MAEAATAPDQMLFFLSQSGDDTDVALAVDRILTEAHQKTVLQTNDFTHQDFMAAMERAMLAGDGGARMVAVVSEAYQNSKHCRIAYRYPLIDDPENERRRLIVLRVADMAPTGFLKPIDYVDLVPVLAIEDDEKRESLFRDVVLAALGLGEAGAAAPFVRAAVTGSTPSTEACVAYLRSESQRADLDDDDLGQIAEALGRQTAAIELAARLFAERPAATTLAYFGALAEHIASAPMDQNYPTTFRAALLTSFEIVEHHPAMQGHSATSILALAAYLPPRLIPPRVFAHEQSDYPAEIRPFIVDASLRELALDLLDRFALIAWRRPTGCISISPQTQRVVRDLLAESGHSDDWVRTAAKLLGSAATPPDVGAAETVRHQTDLEQTAASTAPPSPGPSPAPQGGDTVRRLVQALKEPAGGSLRPPAEPTFDEEPPPLVLAAERAPPRVFATEDSEPVALKTEAVMGKSRRRILPVVVNGAAQDVSHGATFPDAIGTATDPLTPRAPRKTGFLARLFGR